MSSARELVRGASPTQLALEHQRLLAAAVVGLAALVVGSQAAALSPVSIAALTAGVIIFAQPGLAQFALYVLVLAFSFGVVNLGPLFHLGPINGKDVLLFALLAVWLSSFWIATVVSS